MKDQSRKISRAVFAIACSLSLSALSGCVAKTPNALNMASMGNHAKGTLNLAIKWPKALRTQSLPETTQGMVVWARANGNVIQQTSFNRETASESIKLTLDAGTNLSIEVKAYRESTPDPGVNTAIARGIAAVTLRPSESTTAHVIMDLIYDVLSYEVSTLAGGGNGDGQGIDSVIAAPHWVTHDSHGNTYVSQTEENRIRKIDSTGRVTTIAGGVQGYADGQGTLARFDTPGGIAIGPDDNLYVADKHNHRIRRIDAQGNVTTIAGDGSGYADGTALQARFNTPVGLVTHGNAIYITDYNNHCVRKLNFTDFSVTTLAGHQSIDQVVDGVGTAAGFSKPLGIAVDGDGNLFVTEVANDSIRMIVPEGTVTTVAGGTYGFQDGSGTVARFAYPAGITALPTGELFVGDNVNNRIRKITPLNEDFTSCNVTTYAGAINQGYHDAVGTEALFSNPAGIALDAGGNLYIADYSNNRIRKIDSNQQVSTLAGNGENDYQNGPKSTILLSESYGCTQDNQGNFYITDAHNNRIRKIDLQGNVITFAGNGATGSIDGQGTTAEFNYPTGIAADPLGNIYVADSGNSRIRKITSSGVVTTLAGSTAGNEDGQGISAKLNTPMSIAIDPAGNLYVTDTTNNNIRKIEASGNVSTPNQGSSPVLSSPSGIAVDASGSIYVADTGNNCIRRIDASGDITILAGNVSGFADGEGTSAQFNAPKGIAIDRQGLLYIADYGNYRVRRMTPAGVVTTIAGNSQGCAEGQGTSALFNNPHSISVDRHGTLYVTDPGNKRVRRVAPH